jgi:urease accessory protein
MLEAKIRLPGSAVITDDSITLDFDTRQKARIKSQTDSGACIGIFIERGKPLLVGEVLKTDCGKTVAVKGALEPVITASTDDWWYFSKVCYHLGNRHTRLQVGERWLRFQPDHVLSELVQQYGLKVSDKPAIFEPEKGAYSKQANHSHNHENVSSHSHADLHSHSDKLDHD